MLHTMDWKQAIHDPRFWAVRYGCDGRFRIFPGVTRVQSDAYYHTLMEDEGRWKREEAEEGWTLSLAFPDGYTWLIEYSSEDEMDTATYHALLHPTLSRKGLPGSRRTR